MAEITVIGAGLAGISSAIKLAKNGYKTTVYEQNKSIGLGGNNFQAVRNYDLPEDFLIYMQNQGVNLTSFNPITKIIKYAPSGKNMVVQSEKNPLFYVFKRGSAPNSLDAQLYKEALKLGVNFSFNQKKTLSSGDIVASGAIFRNIWGYGAVFEGVNIDSGTIHLFMDNNYAPKGGYIYAIPFGSDRITIAATTFDLNSPLPLLFEKFIKENKIIADLIKSSIRRTYFSGYAYSNVPITAEIKGTKFVGSAAGFVEAARGFGVRYSIESGFLAADSIIENKSYDSLWKKSFEKELLNGLKRRLFFERLSNEDFEKMVQADKIKVSKYEKVPFALANLFKKIAFKKELSDWKNKFSIDKLF
ncbi:MAG: NAD(P)/FAD-dependent oxidoreductase [archaeon]|jgi:flavin-dependent dehydrogenase